MRRTGLIFAGASVLALAWAAGCGESVNSEFPPGPGGDEGGIVMPPPGFETDGSAKDATTGTGCDAGCAAGLTCIVDRCLPPQGKCNDGDAGAADGGDAGLSECQFDTYCDAKTGQCVPFGAPGLVNDPACHQLTVPGNFAPKVKCQFPLTNPIVGDAFPNHVDVQSTPMVARLGGAAAPPSIVAAFTVPVAGSYTENMGVIRILKGTDCTQEATIGGADLDGDGLVDWARSAGSVAIADLDGDKNPEIIAYMSSGAAGANETLMAFTHKSGSWAPLWATKKATLADGTTIFKSNVPGLDGAGGNNWAGPSVHDLDDDGKPEIIREGWVFDGLTGKLRAAPPANYVTYSVGINPVLANLDGDANIEMTNGAHIWEFDGVANAWVEETYYLQTSTSQPGWVAVADFDPYDGKKTPEIAVAVGSTLTIYKTDHSVFMNMNIAVPGTGGGPPTIADFDGDGLPEVALAGRAFYTVFDPDCQGAPRPGGKCADRTHCDFGVAGACVDKILWSRSTQDISSNVTGSSIFDFEADGKAEVIYADECFTRVYDGTKGRVIFSQYRSSCTWLENPIVADVDGDFRAELIVPSNTACGAPGVGIPCTRNLEPGTDIDAQFPGLVCLVNKDCVSGVCDQGLCRCTTSADCCGDKDVAKCEDFGTKCAAPPAGTLGAGNTCRANHPHGVQGIRVFKDAADRWVRSRPIWNQHAYAVTHVNEDGTIPKTSAWLNNWTQPTLDNFRQNVPGNQNATDIGDLTSQVAAYTCNNGTAILTSPVCNRGTAPIGAGVSVGFYVGATKVCGTKTAAALAVGQCETVTCSWASPPSSPLDVRVVPNDDNAIAQCNTENDTGLVKGVACTAPK